MQVRELESRKQLAFEEVREKVKEDLYAGEHQKVMENWEDELLETAGFVIYDQVLEELLAETKASQKA
ncbi:hypothetical protein D1BOALGB6SA_5142 [Olavius sp. associated proteobacterium Delta 1]|nr:hypothetical protein D1BOALGB6SA_5142 [Olavius sp. associated proteobacterium Delta 1]